MRKLVFVMVVLMASACTTTKYVEVPVVHCDTVWENHTTLDSIWMHDSIHVKEKGDTVWYEKWHVNYKEKIVHDTIYKSRVDSVGVPYPVEKQMEKPLTWWQKTRMHLGEALLVLLLVAAVYGFIRFRGRMKL